MSSKRGNWVGQSGRLVSELQSKSEVTRTIEEIKEETGTTMTIESLRERGYWNALREGKKYFDAYTKAGLALKVHVDARGKVIKVTYRLAESHVGA
jgi:hypothetical protein